MTGAVGTMHGFISGSMFSWGVLGVLLGITVWWRDVIREGLKEGHHTAYVQLGLKMGIIRFIVSEVIFFFAIFWAFLWSSLAPVPELGGVWPPSGIDVFSPWTIPLLNTAIRRSSGASCTLAHHGVVGRSFKDARIGLIITVFLAVAFTSFQVYEYQHASFTIADSVYGSAFYLSTGFHGFHVVIGTCFIAVCRVRLVHNQFTSVHHIGLEAAAWYWHFVDVVWLFLFGVVYYWGGI